MSDTNDAKINRHAGKIKWCCWRSKVDSGSLKDEKRGTLEGSQRRKENREKREHVKFKRGGARR